MKTNLKKYYCLKCGDYICFETIDKQTKTKTATITITKLNKIKEYMFALGGKAYCKNCYNEIKRG